MNPPAEHGFLSKHSQPGSILLGPTLSSAHTTVPLGTPAICNHSAPKGVLLVCNTSAASTEERDHNNLASSLIRHIIFSPNFTKIRKIFPFKTRRSAMASPAELFSLLPETVPHNPKKQQVIDHSRMINKSTYQVIITSTGH